MSLKNGFGTWLRGEREARGMTMAALAHKVGITYTHISKIEVGRAQPSREIVRLLARALPADLRTALLCARLLPPEFRSLTDARLQTIVLNFSALPAEAQDAILRIAASGDSRTPPELVPANGSKQQDEAEHALFSAFPPTNGVVNANHFFDDLPCDILEVSIMIAQKIVELSKCHNHPK